MRRPTILVTLTLSLITIQVLYATAIYAKDNIPNNDSLSLVSVEGKSFSFPRYIENISPVIKKVLDYPDNTYAPNEIPLPLTSDVLEQLQPLVALLPKAAHNAQGEKVPVDKLDEKTIFSNKIIQSKIPKTKIRRLSDNSLNELIKATRFLELEPLTNALTHFVAKRTMDIRPICMQMKWDLPQNYIDKHRYFIQSHREEFTVGDYIAQHGQDSVTKEGDILDLSKKKLTGLQGLDKLDHPEQFRKINLDHNLLQNSDLDENYNIFHSFTQLETLSLQENQLYNLPKELFLHLTQLQELYLSGNQLSILPKNLFEPLTLLHTLGLDNNMIRTLDGKIFSSLKQLRHLSLSNNRIKTFPKKLFQHNELLLSLELQNNHLSKLHPESFRSLKQLHSLKLENNRIEVLPNGLFDSLHNLQNLSLSYNRLHRIESDKPFKHLTALKTITLDHNHLSQLPANMLKKSKHLKYAGLHYNHISNISDNFSNSSVKEKIRSHTGISGKSKLCFYPQVGVKNNCLHSGILCGKISLFTGTWSAALYCLPCCIPCSVGYMCLVTSCECVLPCSKCINPSAHVIFDESCCAWTFQSPMCYKD